MFSAAQDLDSTLFGNYIKPKTEALLEIVRIGILDPTLDWFEMSQPTGTTLLLPAYRCIAYLSSPAEIRSFMFETLIYLVGVHAQVSAVAESLLDRALCTLVDALAEDALRCFRTVKRFGMGGMLRVRSFSRFDVFLD